MMKINWEKLAEQHDMSNKEFAMELFMTAMLLGELMIEDAEGETLVLKAKDHLGVTTLIIKREELTRTVQ